MLEASTASTAKLFDQNCLGEITPQNKNHLRHMYDAFSDCIDKEGPNMVRDLNRVVAYQMTDQNMIVVIDLKNKPNGHIFTSDDPSSIPMQPDLILKMKRLTFD